MVIAIKPNGLLPAREALKARRDNRARANQT